MRVSPNPPAVVIGGGPAGLMAAETLAAAGVPVTLFDAMPSVGRKFLLAGKGGMNITHAEPFSRFRTRYREREAHIAPLLTRFDADALRAWVLGLGIDTFVGSSQRVFPADMKAAPLLRAWMKRLRDQGTQFRMRHRWLGWHEDGALRFATPEGEVAVHAGVTVLALGGASWARLGSDGAWVAPMMERSIPVTPLKPANCGFDIGWSDYFRGRFAGQPLKSVGIAFEDASGVLHSRQGECMVTASGIEGSLIYALSAPLRDTIAARGNVTIALDLAPGRDLQRVAADVSHPRGARSMSSHLHGRVGIHGIKAGLLREALPAKAFSDPAQLSRVAEAIKSLPLTLVAPRPIDEAISTAGGIPFEALTNDLMLQALPGIFCAGEMLDWEAPTGGYLLTACFASGRMAGEGAARWRHSHESG
jgi:uncharacterized flavoprotein (TIGR03862 family)